MHRKENIVFGVRQYFSEHNVAKISYSVYEQGISQSTCISFLLTFDTTVESRI